MPKSWKQMSVTIETTEADEWEAFAKELGMSRAGLIRQAVKLFRKHIDGLEQKAIEHEFLG